MLTMASVKLLKATVCTNYTSSSVRFHFKLQNVNWQVREGWCCLYSLLLHDLRIEPSQFENSDPCLE